MPNPYAARDPHDDDQAPPHHWCPWCCTFHPTVCDQLEAADRDISLMQGIIDDQAREIEALRARLTRALQPSRN